MSRQTKRFLGNDSSGCRVILLLWPKIISFNNPRNNSRKALDWDYVAIVEGRLRCSKFKFKLQNTKVINFGMFSELKKDHLSEYQLQTTRPLLQIQNNIFFVLSWMSWISWKIVIISVEFWLKKRGELGRRPPTFLEFWSRRNSVA